MDFATNVIHAGEKPDPTTGAITTPIYQTSTYVQQELGGHPKYEYARSQNPTREALEAKVACLESGSEGIAFSSGMAAIHAVLSLLQAGDHVVATEKIYGGAFRLFEKVLKKFHLRFSWVDTSCVENVTRSLKKSTRLVYLESPTNPLLSLSDIQAITAACRERGVVTAVDNTFLSPYLQRPIELGADLVIHSTTKFLNGHSDSVGGMVVTRNRELGQQLRFLQNAAGAIPGPFDCWLVLRGIKTLGVRMARHDENGRKVSAFLAQHPSIRKVYYPGLEDHPQHSLASRQQFGYGSLMSFDLETHAAAKSLLDSVRLCSLAESLGGVETLISHPASMSHAALPPEKRTDLGITDGLIRLSVGLEAVDDLVEDLNRALNSI